MLSFTERHETTRYSALQRSSSAGRRSEVVSLSALCSFILSKTDNLLSGGSGRVGMLTEAKYSTAGTARRSQV